MRSLSGQDLWRDPSRGVGVVIRLIRIWVYSDRHKAEIRDTCLTEVVYKDARLDMCQRDGKTGYRLMTYSFEISVNHAAGVEIPKAIGDTR